MMNRSGLGCRFNCLLQRIEAAFQALEARHLKNKRIFPADLLLFLFPIRALTASLRAHRGRRPHERAQGSRRQDARGESKPIDTPVGELGEKDTIMHYNAVMLEDLKSKMELVIEFMETVRSELKQQMAELHQSIDQKIDDLRKEMNLKFDALNYKIDKVEEHLSLRMDKVASRLDDHEARLVAIESCH